MISLGIALTSLSRLSGGLFHSVRRSALALAEAGLDVTVYGVEDIHTDEDLAAWAPLTPKVFPRVGPAALGIGKGMARELKAARHDVVHQHGLWQFASIAALASGAPVMISPRGMLDPWARANSGWKKTLAAALFERRNLHRAACLHALNASEVAAIRAYGLGNPIAEIPNGTDIPDLSAPRARPDWLPEDGKRTLLFLGRLHPKKGLAELLRGWAGLRDTAPELHVQWRLVIAGWDDGGHLETLHALAQELGLGEVIFPGPLHGAAKDSAFAHADAFILPSFSEGLPMAVLEAWSWGLPVFMSEACNLPVGFTENAARRVEPIPDVLVKTLVEGLAAPDLDTMGARGRKLASQRFAWTPIAEQHIEAYEWMLQRGARPACVQMGPAPGADGRN